MIELPRQDPWALLATYKPLGILTFQNNGVYSGQETPHYQAAQIRRNMPA